MTAADTVRGRIARTRTELTPVQLAVGATLLAVLGFTLLFFQEPAAHEALHDARHVAAVTCH